MLDSHALQTTNTELLIILLNGAQHSTVMQACALSWAHTGVFNRQRPRL